MSTTASTSPAPSARGDATVMGLVGLAHCISHFSQLLLPPLFPWLKDAFHVGYAELGFLLTVFFVVSCSVQAVSGFVVDRFGPRPILFGGIALLAAAAFGFAASTSYAMLAFFAVVAGIGNGVFHPVDYTLLNRKVHVSRLGHAFSVHGITGSLGWALAPALLVSITLVSTWRVALASAGVLVLVVLVVLIVYRSHLTVDMTSAAAPKAAKARGGAAAHSLGFLAIPAVWMCFGFFFLYAVVISGVQAFAPEAARLLHDVPTRWAAMCLTFYMVASAGGMVIGGFLAADPSRCEKIVGAGFGDRRRARPDDRLRAARADGGAGALRADGRGRRHRRAVARPHRQARRARERDRPRLRRRLFGARHRPGVRAARLRPAHGHASAGGRLARHRDRPGAADHDRVQRPSRAPHGAGAGHRLERAGQTALRCRSMQVASTSSAGRFHQFSLEKISTSL